MLEEAEDILGYGGDESSRQRGGHQAGQLVIFPSWLMHEVLPYLGERERIVVAFNAWIRAEE